MASTGLALQLLDQAYATGQVDAAGDPLYLSFQSPPPGTVWLIDRMVVTNDGNQCQVNVYVQPTSQREAPTLANLVDQTDSGDTDVSEYPRGLLVQSSQKILVAFLDALPGSNATAQFQYGQYQLLVS